MGAYFSYNPGDVPEGAFKISPSQLSRFFDNTREWVGEFFLDEPGFKGNTMSNLGNVVHGLAEMSMSGEPVDYAKAEAFIDSLEDPEIDKAFIRRNYQPMFEALQSQFLWNATGTPEVFLKEEIAPGVFLGGSIDLLNDEEVTDYKATSALNAPTDVRRAYYFQQMCYVWLARKKGMNIKRFRLVYITTHEVGRISEKTGKPMKDYPTTVSHVVHEVTDSDIELIEGVMKLVADFVLAWKAYPEIRHVLAQDYRLKGSLPINMSKEKPSLFPSSKSFFARGE